MADLLDSGTLMLCSLVSTADPGDMPVYKLRSIGEFSFGEREIGVTRAYLAKGADEKIDMIVRIWDEGIRPRIGQYAVLSDYRYQEDEYGDQYRITLVQPTHDDDELMVFDLTLSRLEHNYDFIVD